LPAINRLHVDVVARKTAWSQGFSPIPCSYCRP
jgi:hypothetical protein